MAGGEGDSLVRRISSPDRTPEERGEDAYQLLQEIFRGYPSSGLISLLRSDQSSAVEAGIWVLSELGNKAAPLLNEVESLLRHPSRKVRYWAIDVVHSSAGPENGGILSEALGLLEDVDSAVRRAALYLWARALDIQLSAAMIPLGDSKMGLLLAWLRRVSNENDVLEITRRLESDDRLVRMVAAAAAARIADRDRSALEAAATLADDDISVFASRQLE